MRQKVKKETREKVEKEMREIKEKLEEQMRNKLEKELKDENKELKNLTENQVTYNVGKITIKNW